MEYQKITNLLDDTTNQPSKFRTYIHVKGTITVPNTEDAGALVSNTNKKK